MSSELERVARLAARFGRPATGVGIGDDAAVLDDVRGSIVWTIDAQIEGTHFRLDLLSWEDVGWRSFMAAASDLAAMGALPIAALSALALSDGVDDDALDALVVGQAAAAKTISAPVVGGNLARGKETSVTTTLLGRVDRPILRSGARAGDGLFVAGALGMAAAGLAALEIPQRVQAACVDACVRAWRRPRALIELGIKMRAAGVAAIDVSDGLARDASHVAQASQVTLVLDEQALRAHAVGALEDTARLLGRDPLDFVLGGGEDYAIFAACPTPIEGFVRIGTVETGPAEILLERTDGTRSRVEALGFDHFAG